MVLGYRPVRQVLDIISSRTRLLSKSQDISQELTHLDIFLLPILLLSKHPPPDGNADSKMYKIHTGWRHHKAPLFLFGIGVGLQTTSRSL